MKFQPPTLIEQIVVSPPPLVLLFLLFVSRNQLQNRGRVFARRTAALRELLPVLEGDPERGIAVVPPEAGHGGG